MGREGSRSPNWNLAPCPARVERLSSMATRAAHTGGRVEDPIPQCSGVREEDPYQGTFTPGQSVSTKSMHLLCAILKAQMVHRLVMEVCTEGELHPSYIGGSTL